MAEEFKGRKIGGKGKVAEVDGAYFGGYQWQCPVPVAHDPDNGRDNSDGREGRVRTP